MEFKKKKPRPYEHPIDVCKRLFKEGITFNNGKVLNRKQVDVTISSVIKFIDNGHDITMKFTAHSPSNECSYTMYKSGIFADIIT